MRWQIWGTGLSLAVHVAFAGGVMSIPTSVKHKSTSMRIADSKKKEKKPEPEKTPPKPIEAPERVLRRAAPKPAPAPVPQNTPPPPVANNAPTPSAAMAAMPDFGISLSGGGAGVGIAVPMGGGGGEAAPRASGGGEKRLRPTGARPKDTGEADSDEPLVKPKMISNPRPGYTEEARAAGIQGKVRLRLKIDATGKVIEATIAAGLGHGLDEAALAAVRRWKFEPGTRGGKPVEAPLVVSMTFVLGE